MSGSTSGSWQLRALGFILMIEAAAMVGVVIWLVFDLVTLTPSSFSTAIAVTVLAAIAAIFVLVIAGMCLRRNPRFRGGAVIWQLILIAVAVGSFQGTFAQPILGWAILLPSLAALALSFTRPVTELVKSQFTDDGVI